ncbi:hypothetical protein GSI_06156 [Ganoderma sinense ZZ0214-1]|uniref:Uncharacterized protein n=1 Tax=Ganoderma sinense ZZ0214-1 TaxID=1077348 RepID=A0A2G8SCF8_9APHY|nr:hypothetical protein GSI_06156 [Ganoderma sinense ZZ0214-1]
MAFRPGFGDEPCFGFFNRFCTTSTSTSTQQAASTTTIANPGTTTTTVVISNTPSTTTTSTSTSRSSSSPANPTPQSSHIPSRASSSSQSTMSSTEPSISISSTALGGGFITISQSVTATLTETSIQVTTTSTTPEMLGSQSSGTLSRGAIIGLAFGAGICFFLVVIGGAVLFKRMRRQESPAGQVPTFRSSQFVLNISDSKPPLDPDVEEGRGLTARSPASSSTLSPLRFAPLSPTSQRSALSPALTASSFTHWYSAATHSFGITSPAAITAPSPTPSDPFSEPVFHSRSPPTSDDNHFSPSAGTHIGHEEVTNTREVDAGSVPPSVYRDLEGVYGSLQERTAIEPLPPAYDTLPARRPIVTVRTDVA